MKAINILAVKGFFNDDGFVPLKSIDIPKWRVCIIIILDESVDTQLIDRKANDESLEKIFDGCDELLASESDTIIC